MKKIAIHGAPRSGTTWLGEILNSNEHVIYKYQPLFSYAFKSALDERASTIDIENFFSAIAITADDFLDQKIQRDRGDLPVFNKSAPTHIIYKEVRYHHILANLLQQDPALKLIAMIRNPLAVMASWIAAPREFRHDLGWSINEEWRAAPSKNLGRPEEFYGYEKWKESAHIFLALAQQYPQQTLLLDYDNLLANTRQVSEEICAFAELEFTPQMQQFLQSSREQSNTDTYSVYRSKALDNGWKSTLDDSIVTAIRADLNGSDLARYLDDDSL
ncbi:MAG TPA: sulfotransferase domain-containing protein [Pseudomonadales bacterium]|nr:sulfotransferase domain-containing protein [Pseudomonadales bacterium]